MRIKTEIARAESARLARCEAAGHHDWRDCPLNPDKTAKVIKGALPDNKAARKMTPLATGCLDYFPNALVAVAQVSFIGNEQHNPGKPMRWDRSKSPDEADCLARHFVDRGLRDTDGVRHSAKVAWRALALLQKEIENDPQRD